MYLLSFRTIKRILGLVDIISHIRYPISRAYFNCKAAFLMLEFNLTLKSKGVDTDL